MQVGEVKTGCPSGPRASVTAFQCASVQITGRRLAGAAGSVPRGRIWPR